MRTSHRQNRRGSVLVFTAFMMVVMFAVLIFAVDLGYLQVVRAELQKAADATALAATWDLIDEATLSGDGCPSTTLAAVRTTAGQYAGYNTVAGQSPALAYQDVEIGNLGNPFDPNAQMTFDDPSRFNAVRVRVCKNETQNGPVSLFFARVLGFDGSNQQAEATAVFLYNLAGFRSPPPGCGNLKMLPFALDEGTWNGLLAGNGVDNWTWDKDCEEVTAGPDQILEVNLFPQDTGSPGNRGTVDIGSNNNSTADIARQILYGISPEDLEYHGGELAFDENGELSLNGDTGISAGVKDELEAIKGQPRIIPLFREVNGNGNNAYYTIVRYAGVRIMEVRLTGKMSSKRVMIQPAMLTIPGGIPADPETVTSYFIHSPVWLIH